jgi:RNA polymerase sigma-70 factor (ECF subfamily)
MMDSLTTQVSLLVRIRDLRDTEAWSEFVTLYSPLIYGVARRRGLQDADAADLTQDVLRAVARTAPRFVYDPGRGTFRGWLFTIIRNGLRKWARRRHRRPVAGGADGQRALEEQAAPPSDEVDCLEADKRSRLFRWAAEQVRPAFRPSTWEAFWQTAVEAREPGEVAAALGLTVGAVYIARSRVLARLRDHIRQAQGA